MLIGRDGTDEGALSRRLAVRDAHIALGDKLVAEGRMLFGTALLGEDGNMIGSMLVLDYPSRAELDQWLAVEPYATSGVWEEITISPVRVGPSFVGLHK
ncbi:YciI family protein [Streptomyces sp. NBC_01233]|uniref:YciI family protein n=1 Tax=Streptomyces sp. NBC_01233 TaxID=2903787 RepID=UPI002E10AEC4|nr:YciI family protein [Streptomyces sp. NBC_01233]